MAHDETHSLSRRSFVRTTGLLAGGMLLRGGGVDAGETSQQAGKVTLPCRVLGRTKAKVTAYTLGTAPAGFSKDVSIKGVADLVNAAIDLGVTSIDTARRYGKAEDGVGLGLGRRRKEVFLATKVFADTIQEAEESFSTSLKLLKTDYVDLAYFHNLGARDMKRALEPDGVFGWLLKQKKAGKTRFVGISGHNIPSRFARFIETDEVDVLLTAVNFVDRHTYQFEEKVLPLARKHDMGIVAMKVFGGMRAGFGAYEGPIGPCTMEDEYLERAIRYSLSQPGVATVNIGVHTPEQLRKNFEMVSRFRALSEREETVLAKAGKRLAGQWGEHFGEVKEPKAS